MAQIRVGNLYVNSDSNRSFVNQQASAKSPRFPSEFSESDIRAFEAREGIKLREIESDAGSKDYSEQ